MPMGAFFQRCDAFDECDHAAQQLRSEQLAELPESMRKHMGVGLGYTGMSWVRASIILLRFSAIVS